MTARHYSNTTVETTLALGVGPSDTQISVTETSGMPASFPFSLVLDYQGSNVEVVTVTGLSGSFFTVDRGQDGTAAQAHDPGTTVVHGVTARDLREPQTHISASGEVHGLIGADGDVVGTAATQTLTNKTIAYAGNTLTGVVGESDTQTLTNKTISATSNTLTDIGDTSIASGFGLIPVGAITLWSGSVPSIPSGWALCDGSSGTPDLRDRFVVGAGGAYAVGATGGQDQVTLTVAQMPAHRHAIDEGSLSTAAGFEHGHATSGTGPRLSRTPSHPASGSVNQSDENSGFLYDTGGDQPHENRPPYYALAYIMFTG